MEFWKRFGEALLYVLWTMVLTVGWLFIWSQWALVGAGAAVLMGYVTDAQWLQFAVGIVVGILWMIGFMTFVDYRMDQDHLSWWNRF